RSGFCATILMSGLVLFGLARLVIGGSGRFHLGAERLHAAAAAVLAGQPFHKACNRRAGLLAVERKPLLPNAADVAAMQPFDLDFRLHTRHSPDDTPSR